MLWSSGKTLRTMRMDIIKEQIGSAMYHPRYSISKEEITTPTLNAA